jgi:hypothetical protein
MIFFDPLDREIFERALEAAHAAVEANFPRDALDSDEALEDALRRELIDIALTASSRLGPLRTHPRWLCREGCDRPSPRLHLYARDTKADARKGALDGQGSPGGEQYRQAANAAEAKGRIMLFA